MAVKQTRFTSKACIDKSTYAIKTWIEKTSLILFNVGFQILAVHNAVLIFYCINFMNDSKRVRNKRKQMSEFMKLSIEIGPSLAHQLALIYRSKLVYNCNW